MAKLFKKLKCEMFSNDIDQKTLGKTIGRSQTYVTRRMTGIESFTMDDAYNICDLLEIPYTEIPTYFPKNGVQPTTK